MINPSGLINESMSSSQLNAQSLANLEYYTHKNFQDFLRYDEERNLDISISSVCSTPRRVNPFIEGGHYELNESAYL